MLKVLINGNSVGELIFSKSNINEISMTKEDIAFFNKALEHIKKNKSMYMKLVILLAITIDAATLRGLTTDIGNIDAKIKTLSDSIIHVLVLIAKYGSMGMGLKTMVVTMLNGGNLKDATMAGIHYWLSYVFLQLYPYLYELVEGIRL